MKKNHIMNFIWCKYLLQLPFNLSQTDIEEMKKIKNIKQLET